ncbi:ABC transporter permease [Aquipuribacter hungaricus]|uniref:ABC transporter permease n=1 Tax=Aquipuribacter hungaricus TaxID=545624 RepID=A0ABV7WK13_9MICO
MTLAVHATRVAGSCLQRNAWVCPDYVRTRGDILQEALVEHVGLTLAAVALGLLVALPLGVLASRSRLVETGASSIATVLYTIPSLAMFPLLLAVGLPFGPSIVVVGLAIYTLGILLRNIVVGLHGVPEDTLDAATGMGLSPRRRLWSVELPLALPAIVAGTRIATVSTVALVTVGGLFGYGGLGNLIITGQRTQFNAEVLTATVLVVVLALAADGLLLLLGRQLTPWLRGRAA